jgi:hypothetical protein
MENKVNTYRAHSYFTDNAAGLMQFMQSKGKENKEEEKENRMMNGNVAAAPVAQKNTQSAGRGK